MLLLFRHRSSCHLMLAKSARDAMNSCYNLCKRWNQVRRMCALLELWRHIDLKWTALTSYPCMVMCLSCSEILDMAICISEVCRNLSPWAYSYLVLFVAVIMCHSNSLPPCFPKLAWSERKNRINRAVRAEVLHVEAFLKGSQQVCCQ